jgi:hypothetical protein
MPTSFPSRDLTLQYISQSYQNVVQNYAPGGGDVNEYFLDGLGNVLLAVPSSSIDKVIITSDVTSSMSVLTASFSNISALSYVSNVAILADTALIAVNSDFSISSSWASSSLSASLASQSYSAKILTGSGAVIDRFGNGKFSTVTAIDVYAGPSNDTSISSDISMIGNIYLGPQAEYVIKSDGTIQGFTSFDGTASYALNTSDSNFVSSSWTSSSLSASYFKNGNTTIDNTGFTTTNTVNLPNGTNVDATGDLYVVGTTTLDNGVISTDGSGRISVASLNVEGITTLDAGNINTDGTGNLTVNNNVNAGTIHVTGTSTLDNGAITTDAFGNLTANEFLGPLTGSVFGTASWAQNVVGGSGTTLFTSSTYQITSSRAITASFTLSIPQNISVNSLTASFISASQITASNIESFNGASIGGMSNGITATSSVQVGFGLNPNNNNLNATQIGFNAGQNTTDATQVVQIGYDAGQNSITASSATQIGANAGASSTNATDAVQIGNQAGLNSKIANRSTQIGTSAGHDATTSSFSVMVGWQAATNMTNANKATVVGYNTGNKCKTADSVVMVGYQAGFNSITASNCTFIGANADTLSGSNVVESIALGYNAFVSGSNMCAVGGTGADAVKVTIGGTSAVNRLDVVGNISCSVITASLFFGTSSISNTSSYALNSETASSGGSYLIEIIGGGNPIGTGSYYFGSDASNAGPQPFISGSIYILKAGTISSVAYYQRTTLAAAAGSFVSCSIVTGSLDTTVGIGLSLLPCDHVWMTSSLVSGLNTPVSVGQQIALKTIIPGSMVSRWIAHILVNY